MRISRRLLRPGERILVTSGLHPIRLVGPLIRAGAGIAAALAVGFIVTPGTGDDPVDLACAAVAVLILARLVRRAVMWRRRRVVVTDQRLLQLSGSIIRRVGSLPLDQVTHVDLVQGPLARLLGYGKLEIRAGAEVVTLPALRAATEIWSALCDAVSLDGEAPARRRLAPGLPFDQQDTGPLPRVVV